MEENVGAQLKVISVHILTSLGTICALMALLAVVDQSWAVAFSWLGLAYFIDGIDGPLARRVRTTEVLPRFSGEQLDLIVDYITYCFIPAFIVIAAKLVPEGTGIVAASLILLTSLYHFVDKNSKTKDGYFVGFPAIWNIIVFYLMIFELEQWPSLILILILFLGVLTFVPFKWLHPVRVEKLWIVTAGVTFLWFIACIWVIFNGMQATWPLKAVLLSTMLYGVLLSLSRSLIPGLVK